MTNLTHILHWEDPDERLIYARLDDRAWEEGEHLFGYTKNDSLYIYHDGRLAAFYSTKDVEEEAKVGHAFYSNEKNVLRVIEIKAKIKKEVTDFVSAHHDLQIEKLSDVELKDLLLKTLDFGHKALRAHFLTQPQFFYRFESEQGNESIKRFEELSKARFEYSRKAWSLVLHFGHKLFTEYGKRHGLSLAQAENMTEEELKTSTIDKELFQKRSQKYVLLSVFHKQTVLIEKDADAYIEKYEQYAKSDSVTGIVGNKGIVRAPAFVLKNENLDLKKLPQGMQKGMVLIVQNAWPELVAYYPLASAIVANEGGITSHGVVVAREFKIPCIVRTHIATKIFNTGDVVEVNANEGVVKILKRGRRLTV